MPRRSLRMHSASPLPLFLFAITINGRHVSGDQSFGSDTELTTTRRLLLTRPTHRSRTQFGGTMLSRYGPRSQLSVVSWQSSWATAPHQQHRTSHNSFALPHAFRQIVHKLPGCRFPRTQRWRSPFDAEADGSLHGSVRSAMFAFSSPTCTPHASQYAPSTIPRPLTAQKVGRSNVSTTHQRWTTFALPAGNS